VCAFHQAIFQNLGEVRAVVNIGGITNITLLPDNPNTSVSGFDTGPGNTLLDAWASRHLNIAYDESGTWAASGTVHQPMLDEMLKTPYLKLIPPKSTGLELFNLTWLDSIIDTVSKVEPQDIQATISSFTAITISQEIRKQLPNCQCVIACGGAHNQDLTQRLQVELGDIMLETSNSHSIDPDQVEAMAFAWLARQTMLGLPGNVPAVTGADGPRVLGGGSIQESQKENSLDLWKSGRWWNYALGAEICGLGDGTQFVHIQYIDMPTLDRNNILVHQVVQNPGEGLRLH